MAKLPNKFIFMKVGNHANESWEDILARKQKEYQRAGMIFWGYGGASCHPLNQVQPFARLSISEGRKIELLMHPINSKADQDSAAATEYSTDGVDWKPIPDGIVVTGSRYALVLNEIKECDLEVALDSYAVGMGPSRGKIAAEYIKGRLDKACLEAAKSANESRDNTQRKKVQFRAELLEPFAVLLRK